MAKLPADRMDLHKPPFYNTGVDYFGPLFVKIGRSRVKRWGVLFTCLTTRAVHLDLAGDLSTDSFIQALRRFCARRGHPHIIRSDNGTNFVGADRELKKSLKQLDQGVIANKLAELSIEWHFNPPSAPHFGGVFEIMVKLTKRALRAISRDRVFKEESLLTILSEVEAILNSRPLTAVSDDPSDFEALTPNHFILGRASPNLPPGNFDRGDLNSRKHWRQVQATSDMFWSRWRREYLPTLSKRGKWSTPQRNLKEKDLVIVINDDAPRSHWPLARIVKVFPGDDDKVRVAEVKTANGTFIRPAAKLYFLEETY